VTFTRFALLMAPAWLLVIGIEYTVFRRFFAAGLAAGAAPPAQSGRTDVRVFTLAVLALAWPGAPRVPSPGSIWPGRRWPAHSSWPPGPCVSGALACAS
jgi:hypothetical protein